MAKQLNRSPVTGNILYRIDLEAAEKRGKVKAKKYKKMEALFVSPEASRTVWRRAGL